MASHSSILAWKIPWTKEPDGLQSMGLQIVRDNLVSEQEQHSILSFPFILWGFPGSSDGKVSACNVGNLGSIPGSGRSPGEGNGNPLQYPCLENPVDGGTWQATVHRVAKSRTRLSNFTFTFHFQRHIFEYYLFCILFLELITMLDLLILSSIFLNFFFIFFTSLMLCFWQVFIKLK